MKWQFFLLTGILIAVVLAAGCTDEETPVNTLGVTNSPLPGQNLVTIGDITGDGLAGGTINTITFTVGLVPGAKMIDMEKISIIYADTIKTETLKPVEGYRGDPARGEWGILYVTNELGNPNNRLEDKEQFTISIHPWAYLPANRMVTIVVRTPDGTPLTIRRFAPPTIIEKNNILINR
ncbi:MAG: hypothetical protein WCX22_00720 [Methanoregula sp.]